MLALLFALVGTLHVTDVATGSGFSYGQGGGGTTDYERRGDAYSDGSQAIPRSAVEALRKALVESEKAQTFDPRAFGITPEWVRDSRPELLRAADIPADAKIPPEIEAKISFESISAMVKRRYQGGMACDDCVSVRVGVRLDGTDGFEVWSDQDIATMIPWHVTMAGRSWKTFSLDVSRAVAKMLSGSSRQRIENVGFWPNGIFRDLLLFLHLDGVAAASLGAAKVHEMPGAAVMLQRFEIVNASLRHDRLDVTLRPKRVSTYEQVRWSNMRDPTSWNALLAHLDGVDWRLSRMKWWKSATRGRQVSLSFAAQSSDSPETWIDAGMHGQPDVSVELSGGDPRTPSRASFSIGPDDDRVLVDYLRNVPEIDGSTVGMTGGVRTYLVGTRDGKWQRYRLNLPPPALRRMP